MRRKLRNPSGDDSTFIWILAAASGAYVLDFPAGIRSFVNARVPGLAGILPASGSPLAASPTGGDAAPSPPTATDDASIVRWSQSVNVPVCVGRRFVGERGRFPGSIDELVAWGNQNGLRTPSTQTWHC